MAMRDYGYILLRDGKLIDCTDNHMFMEKSDIGVDPVDSAFDFYGNKRCIKDDFFAYVGDNDLMLCFYKTHIVIVKGTKVLGTIWCGHANDMFPDDRNIDYSTLTHETLFNPFNCGIDIKISLLDSAYYFSDCGTQFEYEPNKYMTAWEHYKKCIGWENERQSAYSEREYARFIKNMRRSKVLERIYNSKYFVWQIPDTYTATDQILRFDVTFTLNGHEYEVIFGYGVEGFKEHYPLKYTAQEVWSLMCIDPKMKGESDRDIFDRMRYGL